MSDASGAAVAKCCLDCCTRPGNDKSTSSKQGIIRVPLQHRPAPPGLHSICHLAVLHTAQQEGTGFWSVYWVEHVHARHEARKAAASSCTKGTVS